MSSTLTNFQTITYVFAFLFAASCGSFANVVIYRLPLKLSLISPPSSCPKCKNRIKPYDNIPIFSWIMRLGRCRYCSAKISLQYPAIELLSAVLGLAITHTVFSNRWHFALSSPENLLLTALTALFLFIFIQINIIQAVIDLKTTELIPSLSFLGIALGLITALTLPNTGPLSDIVGNIEFTDALLGCIIGGGVIFAIILLYYLFTKKIGMGGGDIWMMAMVGAFLGWQSLFFIFLAASLQGIIIALIGVVLGAKQKTDQNFALFRNHELAELEKQPTNNTDNTTNNTDNTLKNTDVPCSSSEESLSLPTPKLAIPFGPFISLAAIEYLFFAKTLLPLISGNVLTPWGFLP